MKDKTHFMVDIETLGGAPNGVIASIGVVVFDPYTTSKPHDSMHLLVDVEDAQKCGLVCDANTVMFWLNQPKQNQHITFSDGLRTRLTDALSLLSTFMWNRHINSHERAVWFNGATFDDSILTTAYRLCDLEKPWHFRNTMCMRTLKALMPSARYKEIIKDFSSDLHCAETDAVGQAQVVQRVMEHLGVTK